jgi:nitronate monooxygenase
MSHLITTISRSYPWMKTPFIVSAPMRVMSGPTLAVAVSRAGGLGFIGPGVKTQGISSDLEEASTLIKKLSTPQSQPSVLQNQPVLPVGIGFQLWSDDIEVAISTITKHKPCAAWLFAPRNGQKDLDTWSRRIRHASPSTRIWIQIGTLAEARELLQGSEEPDVIVVQGAEAGGHGRANDGLGIMALLPEVMDCLPPHIPVFAAGGLADGRGAAAALCLGATGVVMGTRFLAATEARIGTGYQREIVRASDGGVSTTRTLLYNQLRGTVGWPEEYSPRTIINESFIEHQAGRPFDELKKLHDEAVKAGDAGWGPEGRLATYAGAAIGLIHDVKDAERIVQDVQEEVLQRLSNVQKANSAQ